MISSSTPTNKNLEVQPTKPTKPTEPTHSGQVNQHPPKKNHRDRYPNPYMFSCRRIDCPAVHNPGCLGRLWRSSHPTLDRSSHRRFTTQGRCKQQKTTLQQIWIPSRELTYPTWGKGKSSSNMPYQGDMLISWRVAETGYTSVN